MCVCVCMLFLRVMTGCLREGLHHSQSVKPHLWDAQSWSLLFLLCSIIPTCLLWIHLLLPLSCMWSFLLSLCTGLLFSPILVTDDTISVFCFTEQSRYPKQQPQLAIAARMLIFPVPAWCSVTDADAVLPPRLLWLNAFHHLRASLSWAGMQCVLLTSSAGTRTSWLLESLSHVLHHCLQSLFPHADRGR